jgi:outer membrane protein
MTMQRPKIGIATVSFLLLLLQHSATAQTQGADSLISEISSGPAVVYSIQQCIDSALRNNLNVKTAEFAARTAQTAYIGQIGTALPYLSAYGQYFNNGGKSVNTVTYTYITENYNQGYGQIGGQWTIFNGFSIQNFIKQYSLAYKAYKKDWEFQKDVMTITIIQDFLAIMGTEEQLDLSQKQAADIRRSADFMTIQDSLGAIPHSNLTDQKAALNSAELTIVNTKNTLEQSKLKLANDMNVPYTPNMDVVKLNVDLTPVLYNASVDQVYQNALHNIASIQAAELHLESAKKGVLAARGNMAPTLNLSYGVNSNYSTAATTTASLGTSYYQDGSYVNVNGTQQLVNYPYTVSGATKGVPFNTQFKANVYTSIGLTLNVPILSGLRYRVAYMNSKITRDQAIFNQKTINATLRQNVEASYVTMMQYFRAFNVTFHEVQNYEESYREAAIKFDNGALPSLAFVIYNTNKNVSELNLIAAKYNYILATKILDFYQGQLTW